MIKIPLDQLVGGLLGFAFGNPLAVGIIGFFLFVVFLVAIKISFEGAFGLSMAFIHVLAVFGYLPFYALYGILIIDGLIIAVAVLRLTGRR